MKLSYYLNFNMQIRSRWCPVTIHQCVQRTLMWWMSKGNSLRTVRV